MTKDLDLVSKLDPDDRIYSEFAIKMISPNDAKYGKASRKFSNYLSHHGEQLAFVRVQRELLATRVEFGKAGPRHLSELDLAIPNISPLNILLIEEQITRHDQLAVIEELGRYISAETKALLHPGTTSYDIVDTARAYLFRTAWNTLLRPAIALPIITLCDIAQQTMNVVQVGRTHLQHTSPVLLGGWLATYARRLADRLDKCDTSFDGLTGKISGIVGTGASIDAVIGEGRSLEFERKVLEKLGLQPDHCGTQITQKEALADVGHNITTISRILGSLCNDIRLLYSSEIKEVTSRDSASRLGGSSADALKNNPADYENIAGKSAIIESGMRVLYEMIESNLQRDLRNSVQGRYQPQAMMVEAYEAFTRFNKALSQFSINEDRIKTNLLCVREKPSEAMVSILRGAGYVHPTYGVGHDFVKKIGQQAQREGKTLADVALQDPHFRTQYEQLPRVQQDIINGALEHYLGSAKERALRNIATARNIATRN